MHVIIFNFDWILVKEHWCFLALQCWNSMIQGNLGESFPSAGDEPVNQDKNTLALSEPVTLFLYICNFVIYVLGVVQCIGGYKEK